MPFALTGGPVVRDHLRNPQNLARPASKFCSIFRSRSVFQARSTRQDTAAGVRSRGHTHARSRSTARDADSREGLACCHPETLDRALELVQANPVTAVERPRIPRRRWRILEPHEVPRVCKACSEDRARRMFPDSRPDRPSPLGACGPLEAREPRRPPRGVELAGGERLIALPPSFVDALAEQFTSSPYRADEDFVFAHPERGTKPDAN